MKLKILTTTTQAKPSQQQLQHESISKRNFFHSPDTKNNFMKKSLISSVKNCMQSNNKVSISMSIHFKRFP